MDNPITEKLRQFIVQNFMLAQQQDGLTEDTSFLNHGIIDSTGILELIGFTERTYGLHVEDEELTPDNLDSLRKLTDFIQKKQCVMPEARV